MKGWTKLGLGIGGAIITAFGGKAWVDRHIYNDDGYNALGYDRSGYDRNGYDKDGYNIHGFNRYGFDRNGYDREGFNAEGYNASGYNRNGYNRYGFDRNGRDADGFDRSGYNYFGFNRNKVDRSSHDLDYYVRKAADMEENQRKSYRQLKENNFRYALSDIRVGIETGVRSILAHKVGTGYEKNPLDTNIGACERNKLFDHEFIGKLYSAKNHCNAVLHPDEDPGDKTFEQIYFCYKVLCEITDELKLSVGLAT